MPVSKKQQACVKRYNSKSYDFTTVRVPKGKKALYQAEAERRGLSLNQLIALAIEQYLCSPKK